MKIYQHSSESMHEVSSATSALVVTSPPYPMIAKWDTLFGKVDFFKQHLLLDRVWKECFRVLCDGGLLCVNIGDATRTVNKQFCCYPNYARVVLGCMRIGFTPLIPILWKKISNRPNAFLGSGFLPPNGYIAQDCEYIAILRKGALRKFHTKDPIRYKSAFSKKKRDLWFQQLWTVPGKAGAKATSSFPIEIPKRLIQMFSIIGDLVIDPFAGSGTTGEAAKVLSRRFVGYEVKKQ